MTGIIECKKCGTYVSTLDYDSQSGLCSDCKDD